MAYKMNCRYNDYQMLCFTNNLLHNVDDPIREQPTNNRQCPISLQLSSL